MVDRRVWRSKFANAWSKDPLVAVKELLSPEYVYLRANMVFAYFTLSFSGRADNK
jgi:alanine dehydrogenase